MCNKSIESSIALTKTFSYLNTRGLGRLRGADLLLLYQLVRADPTRTNSLTKINFLGIYQGSVPE